MGTPTKNIVFVTYENKGNTTLNLKKLKIILKTMVTCENYSEASKNKNKIPFSLNYY